MATTLDRRGFLKLVSLSGGGFALGFLGYGEASQQNLNFVPNPWVRLEPSGTVTILVDKSEMGQGVTTALPMILAEEMDADWSKIRVEFAPAAPEYAHPWYHTQATGGSTSVRAMWLPLRHAGATARLMLRLAAAATWNLPLEQVKTSKGVLSAGLHQASYGGMAAAASRIPVPQDAPLKDPKTFQLIGKPLPRLDSVAKATGAARFGMDMHMPGLLTAVVARAPVVGAKVVRYDGSAALKLPGVRFVVPVQTPTSAGIAVLAETTWQALKGRDLLTIEWDSTAHQHLDTAQLRRDMAQLALSGEGAQTAVQRANPDTVQISQTLQSVYEVPYLAHATMEPLNCTAWVRPDEAEIWVGTQAQGPSQMIAAQLTGLPTERIKIHTQYLGGGFGRRFAPDFVIEAVSLSKSVQSPVKVVYTREDDMHAAYYRPMALCALQAGLDGRGRPAHWHGVTVTDSIAEGTGFESVIIKGGVDQTAVEGLADIAYDIPQFKVDWIRFHPGVRVWFWRSVGHTQNAFFAESFIDELAHAAAQDPFEYRRALLGKSPRQRTVLELAAARSQWGRPLPAGHALGIAVVESFGSVVAEVAEVSLQQGKPRVHRVVIAADVGMVINPDTVAAQLEGAMNFGLSAALYGQITFSEGQPRQSNFNDYPLVRLAEMPQVEVHLVPSGDAPGGVGEPGTPPIAPAVCNALFALTGQRVYRLPLSEHNFSGA
ncbi:MAG: xanthine dehydrogenase family protein molybdopterin-binding subunit [Betaproteobacteria bacterium]|nr:xanthine dehydrogenase family protein molybdopterin-binding subunit [Betaproteobacteria bacterium]